MADIKVYRFARKFADAQKALAEALLRGLNAELWLIEPDSRGRRYAVITRAKRGEEP